MFVIQGLYDGVWKDWTKATPDYEQAKRALDNYVKLIRPKPKTVCQPSDSRIVKRYIHEEVVDG